MSNPTIESHVDAVLREYRNSVKGSAYCYIKLARKLASSGISKTRALEIISNNFPAEAKAFQDAEQRGEKLPQLFPREGESYELRRSKALARGGVIS
jgi:hypothetical protein